MTLNIKLKRSATKNSEPAGSQLEDGELGLNYNADSLALYCKDTNGAIRQIAGKGGEGSYWNLSGTTLSPEDDGYNVYIKGGIFQFTSLFTINKTNPGSFCITAKLNGEPKFNVKASGSIENAGPIRLFNNDISGNPVILMGTGGSITANGNITAKGDLNIGVQDDAGNAKFTVSKTTGNVTNFGAYNNIQIRNGPASSPASTGANYIFGTSNSGKKLAGGTNNIAIGKDTLANLVSTNNNLAIGHSAQQNAVSASANVAVGGNSLRDNVDGERNTCVGYNSGNKIKGDDNTIVGRLLGDETLSSTILFGAGSIERARCDSTGTWSFTVTKDNPGNITAKGFIFGEPSGSATSKTLNDYEEGTFTPTLESEDGTLVVTYDASGTNARYVKVGTLVYVSGRVRLSASNSIGNDLRLGGLPYETALVVASKGAGVIGSAGNWGDRVPGLTMAINSSTFADVKVNSTTVVRGSDTTDTSVMFFNFSYLTT